MAGWPSSPTKVTSQVPIELLLPPASQSITGAAAAAGAPGARGGHDRVKVPPLATQLALQHQAPGHTAAVSGLLESVWNDKDKDTGGHAQNVKGGDAWQGSKRPHTAVKDGPNRDQQPGHHSHHPPQQQQGTSPRGRKYGSWYVPPADWRSVYSEAGIALQQELEMAARVGPNIAGQVSGAGDPAAALRDLATSRQLQEQQDDTRRRLGQTYTIRAYKEHLRSKNEPEPAAISGLRTPTEDDVARFTRRAREEDAAGPAGGGATARPGAATARPTTSGALRPKGSPPGHGLLPDGSRAPGGSSLQSHATMGRRGLQTRGGRRPSSEGTDGSTPPVGSRAGVVPVFPVKGGAVVTSSTSPYSLGDLELDEIISPEMRAAVRKTLAMRDMVAAHEATMARYRAVRRKQEALANALKARGLLPQSVAGSMASLARYLTSPHAVSATLSPQAQAIIQGAVAELAAASPGSFTTTPRGTVVLAPPPASLVPDEPLSPPPLLKLPAHVSLGARSVRFSAGGSSLDEALMGNSSAAGSDQDPPLTGRTSLDTDRTTQQHQQPYGEGRDGLGTADSSAEGGGEASVDMWGAAAGSLPMATARSHHQSLSFTVPTLKLDLAKHGQAAAMGAAAAAAAVAGGTRPGLTFQLPASEGFFTDRDGVKSSRPGSRSTRGNSRGSSRGGSRGSSPPGGAGERGRSVSPPSCPAGGGGLPRQVLEQDTSDWMGRMVQLLPGGDRALPTGRSLTPSDLVDLVPMQEAAQASVPPSIWHSLVDDASGPGALAAASSPAPRAPSPTSRMTLSSVVADAHARMFGTQAPRHGREQPAGSPPRAGTHLEHTAGNSNSRRMESGQHVEERPPLGIQILGIMAAKASGLKHIAPIDSSKVSAGRHSPERLAAKKAGQEQLQGGDSQHSYARLVPATLASAAGLVPLADSHSHSSSPHHDEGAGHNCANTKKVSAPTPQPDARGLQVPIPTPAALTTQEHQAQQEAARAARKAERRAERAARAAAAAGASPSGPSHSQAAPYSQRPQGNQLMRVLTRVRGGPDPSLPGPPTPAPQQPPPAAPLPANLSLGWLSGDRVPKEVVKALTAHLSHHGSVSSPGSLTGGVKGSASPQASLSQLLLPSRSAASAPRAESGDARSRPHMKLGLTLSSESSKLSANSSSIARHSLPSPVLQGLTGPSSLTQGLHEHTLPQLFGARLMSP